MIKFDALDFSYGDFPVLEDISLNLTEGSFHTIIGPNGGGKTTFLKLLMGLLEPSRGTIRINGLSPKKARKTIGYVPQSKGFDRDFPLTVLELVLMGLLSKLNILGRFNAAQRQKALEAIDRVGLKDFANHPFGKLSGGQAQRALIARALVDEPKILLLDEPTANVDPAAEKQIYELIRKLKGSTTILMVTHDLPGMIKDSDSVLIIQQNLREVPPEKVCGHFAMGLYHQEGK